MAPKDESEDVDGVIEESQSSTDSEGHAQEEAPLPVQKRKGGRKPIYASAEERKQRNRRAQAEFRGRRTAYVSQLEIGFKKNESKIEEMQESHDSISKECQTLRHRNQLLERLLTDKGVDVQSELQAGCVISLGRSSESNKLQNSESRYLAWHPNSRDIGASFHNPGYAAGQQFNQAPFEYF